MTTFTFQKQATHFTLPVSIGTPAQTTHMLIDLSSKFTYAFTPATHTFLTLPHKFYIK